MNSAITGYIKKTIDNPFIFFIVSILLASIVFKYVLSIDTFKNSALVAIISQIIIIVFLTILIGMGAVALRH